MKGYKLGVSYAMRGEQATEFRIGDLLWDVPHLRRLIFPSLTQPSGLD
jgi:hypothetical protein